VESLVPGQKSVLQAIPLNAFVVIDGNRGFDGLIKIGRHALDLVITDLHMPEMDSVWLIRHLRGQEDNNRFDIIVVAALDATEMEDARKLLRGIPVYSKPVPFRILRALIENKLHVINTRYLKT